MVLPSFLLFALFSATVSLCGAEPKVPAIYVFGDSTADVGNNNYLPGKGSQANYPHYGIDFPHRKPTGRFSNGYNGVDFLAIHMGFRRSPPPYLAIVNKTNHQAFRGLQGANFASGGSGILSSTGTKGSTITMAEQIKYFTEFQSDLVLRIGMKSSSYLLSKSIFLISSGGNDLFGFFSQMDGSVLFQWGLHVGTGGYKSRSSQQINPSHPPKPPLLLSSKEFFL